MIKWWASPSFKTSSSPQKHMQHGCYTFTTIQQQQSMHSHKKHQRKQLKVLHWFLPGSTAAHIFIGGFLPLHWEHDGSSMLGDSLQVWVAKAPHLSIPHLSCPSPPCCLQLHRRHRYRSSWGVIAVLHRRQKWWNGQYFCLRFLRSASDLAFNTRLDGHNKFFWL